MRLVAGALGVLPDHDVRVFVGIEGKHDESFFKIISATLSQTDSTIDSMEKLEEDGKLIFIPVGGSNVGLWVSRLHNLNRPEFHIFDRDTQPPAQPHYQAESDLINARNGCKAVHTSKAELENYLHSAAITAARSDVVLAIIGDFDDVPSLVAQQVQAASDQGNPWAELDDDKKSKKVSRAKAWLNKDAALNMTADMLTESDPSGDIIGWLREITTLARQTP